MKKCITDGKAQDITGACVSRIWETDIEENPGAGQAGRGPFPEQWAPVCSKTFLPEGPVASGSAVLGQIALPGGSRQMLLLEIVG